MLLQARSVYGHTLRNPLFPLFLPKTDQNNVVADENWPLHQHAVRRDQCKQVTVGHGINGFFQPKLLVFFAVSVDEFPFI